MPDIRFCVDRSLHSLAFALIFFLWSAENPAIAHFPFLTACSHACTLSVSWQLSTPCLWNGSFLQPTLKGPPANPIRSGQGIPAFSCLNSCIASSHIPIRYFLIPFFGHNLPPDAVLFSYIRRPFVYCPVLLVRFIVSRFFIWKRQVFSFPYGGPERPQWSAPACTLRHRLHSAHRC